MQGPRDELLARPVLARDQHPRVGGGDAFDSFEDITNCARNTDDLKAAVHLAAEKLNAFSEPPELQNVTEGHQQPVSIQRLFEKVERSLLCSVDRSVDRPMSTDHDHVGRRVQLTNSGKHLESVEPGHLNIQKGDVGSEGLV